MTNSRDIDFTKSLGKGLARTSTVGKRSSKTCPTHPGMEDRTNDTVGAAPTGRPADAVDPSLYTTEQGGKSFDIPKASWGMKDGDGRGIDETSAHRVMAEAKKSPDDFAKSLHTTLPQGVTEGT